MKLGILLSCALASTGCDGLFHLVEVGPGVADGGTDAPDGDTGIDASIDGNAGLCDTVPIFTGTGKVLHAGLQSAAIASDESFALIVNAGNIFQIAIPETVPTAISPQTGAWTNPAMTPGRDRFYALNTTDTKIYQWLLTGAAWTVQTNVPSLPSTSWPGAVGKVPASNELRMPLLEGTEMRERASIGGNDWSVGAQFTRSLQDLTGLTTGTVKDFALTADASTLVFVVTGSGMDGVWYIRRSDYALANNFMTTTAVSYGRILASSQSLSTPYLTPTCHLYVVINQVLYRFDS